MIRFLSLAALAVTLTLVSLPAQAGGGRASAQTFRAAAGGCSQASAQAGGYCPAPSAQIYRQQVIRQAVPVMQYQQVQRVVEVPVQVQAVERQVYTEYVPAQQVIQQEVVAPSYTVQSQAAVGYAPVQSSAAAVSYGASASAVAAPAAVVQIQRAPLFGGRLFGARRGRTVSKSKSVTRN